MDNTEVPRIATIVRTDTLITIDTAIPRVATTDPFSVPGSTSAATCAILAHGILILEIFPDKNAI